MTNRTLYSLGRVGISLAAVGMATPVLLAQTITTGSVEGVVKDATGATVAGATVRIVSSQITRTVVTGVDGRYRMPLLNAGAWEIKVTKPGFSPQSQKVLVSINAATSVNFRLAQEASAIVEVSASAASIDTTSTTTGTNYSLDAVAPIPKGRDITDIAFLTPGVSSSGFGKGNGLGLDISINGASGAENSYSIDGLSTNDMRYGGAGVNLVTDFVEQVDVQTGGYKPEYSALGGVFNVVTKSGSNEFMGSTWFTDTPSSLRPGPKRNAYTAEDAANSRYDAGFWVGGPILKDRLFYSVGVDYDREEQPGQLNNSNLPIPKQTTTTNQIFAKLNGYINTDNQLTFSYFGTPAKTSLGHSNTVNIMGDGRGTADYGADTTHKTSNWSVIWDGILTPSMNISVKVGKFKLDNEVSPLASGSALVHDMLYDSYNANPTDPSTWEPGLIWSTGGYGLLSNEHNETDQKSVDFNWVLGNHGLKMGISQIDSKYSLEEHYTGGARYTVTLKAGVPFLRERVITNDATVKAQYRAFYVQDVWQATPALNIFFGARLEDQEQKAANGATFLKFDMADYIQPRVGFTWDVLGEGKSKLSGSYGRYYEKIPQRMAIREFGGEVYYEHRYGGGRAGSVFNYDPNSANHLGTFSGTYQTVDYAGSFNNPPIADGVKLPQRDEFQLGYEQQVTSSIKLGIQGHYRKLTNPIEDSVFTDASGLTTYDPNGMAAIWNPKPGPVSFQASDGSGKVTVDKTLFPEAYNTYKAVDLTFEWKSERSQIHATYTWSRLEGNYEGLITSSNGQSDGNITASYDYFPYVGSGLMPLDREHVFKLFGAHTFTIAGNPLHTGFNFLWQSGTPISLWDDGSTSNGYAPGFDSSWALGDGTVASQPNVATNWTKGAVGDGDYTGPTHGYLDIGVYGDGVPANGKIGDRGRTPSYAKLDLSLDYEIPLGGKLKLVPMLSVFNVFNARAMRAVNEQATDSGGTAFPAGKWRSATAWYAGRSVMVGAKLHF